MRKISYIEAINLKRNNSKEQSALVAEIIADVRKNGDIALRKYTQLFDKTKIENFKINPEKIKKAKKSLPEHIKTAVNKAIKNLRTFSELQLIQLREFTINTVEGVFCSQKIKPINSVGIYVPGGKYPLISSLIMGAVPALVAGVDQIIVCTPPSPSGINPTILATCSILGIKSVYSVGGAQAIAAMAYGTETIPKVDKIVGPGNKYVATAKSLVFGDCGIDMPAGPSELLIIADKTANPEKIAYELLAQAEHDTDTFIMFICLDKTIEQKVTNILNNLTQEKNLVLPDEFYLVTVENIEQAISIANLTAPEHLLIDTYDNSTLSKKLNSFGTLFIGKYATVAFGDYAAGINHILPTSGGAKFRGGLSVFDFIKVQTELACTHKGYLNLAPTVKILAEAEGLLFHKKCCEF